VALTPFGRHDKTSIDGRSTGTIAVIGTPSNLLRSKKSGASGALRGPDSNHQTARITIAFKLSSCPPRDNPALFPLQRGAKARGAQAEFVCRRVSTRICGADAGLDCRAAWPGDAESDAASILRAVAKPEKRSTERRPGGVKCKSTAMSAAGHDGMGNWRPVTRSGRSAHVIRRFLRQSISMMKRRSRRLRHVRALRVFGVESEARDQDRPGGAGHPFGGV